MLRMKGRLLVVTDAFNDVDDAVALYALAKSDAHCAGVVTTYGNEMVKARAVSKFLRMAGKPDMPVRYSRNCKTRFKAPNEMAEVDYGFLTEEELKADDRSFGIGPKGEEFIHGMANSSPGGISILSLAPLSVLADAMDRLVKRIYAMGGHVGGYDNGPNATYDRAQIPEYNFACDPAAARNVLASGAEIFVVGKNLWTKDLFTPEDFEFLSGGSKPQRELLRMIKSRHDHNQKTLSLLGVEAELFMYDPIALGAVLFPELYDFEKIEMAVDERGVTHTRPTKKGNVHGAVGADLKKIKENILYLLSS